MKTTSKKFKKFNGFTTTLFIIPTILILAICGLQAQTVIYWTAPQANMIKSANTNNLSSVTTLLNETNGLNDPRMIALDAVNEKIYWVNFNISTIQRADLDGSNAAIIITSIQGVNFPYGITIDESNGHVYWSNWGDHSIRRANLNGGAAQALFTRTGHGVFAVIGIGVDVANGKMYWLSRHNNLLRQADTNGSNLQNILTQADGLSLPNSLVIDAANNRIFWTNEGTNTILTADLDGNNINTFLDAADGLQQPLALSLDAAATRIYWTNNDGAIKRAQTDGSNIETLLTFEGNEKPLGITVFGMDPVAISSIGNLPDGFALENNYPNPFNPSTTINFKIGARNPVSLKIFNSIGQEIKTLREGVLSPGEYSAQWDATNNLGEAVSSGVYFYQLTAGKFIANQKMLLLR